MLEGINYETRSLTLSDETKFRVRQKKMLRSYTEV